MIRGRWVKLVVEGSASWRRLPLAVRSIGYAVSTVVDEDGSLECGDERPADVLVRLLAAHPDERKLVRALLAKLAAAGFLVVEGQRARLLDPAQTPANVVAITPAKGGRNGGAMGVAKVPPPATGNAAESLDSQNARIDQTRPDQTRIPSASGRGLDLGGFALEGDRADGDELDVLDRRALGHRPARGRSRPRCLGASVAALPRRRSRRLPPRRCTAANRVARACCMVWRWRDAPSPFGARDVVVAARPRRWTARRMLGACPGVGLEGSPGAR